MGTFITLKSKLMYETLFLRNCIYMYTHISIYIHIHKSPHTLRIQLLKNTDRFTTIAPLTFIIIHSKIFIHMVETGMPAFST